MINWSTLGKVACGFLIGTAGVKVLGSKDAKKCYTHITAAAYRCKDTCLETYTNIKENCQDISADAKEINEKRYADERAKEIEDAKAVLANAEAEAAEEKGLVHEEKHTKATYIVAHGISSTIDNQKVCIGSHHYIFEDEKCSVPDGENELFDSLPPEYSHLYMAIGEELAAVILIEDPLRDDAPSVIRRLKETGFENVVMMTGDSERTARSVAEKAGVTRYFSEVLPEDKANFIRKEHEAGRKVIMIGDGINDSPALSEADAGIAVSTGASIAREIADITISSDDLGALLTLRSLSTKLIRRINLNYNSIIGFNSFLIIMGMLGIFTPTTTAFLHNASTIALSMKSMTNLLDE